MTCSTCRYWKADKVLGLSVSGAQKFGECRRYPPAPKWPSTEMDDWCGEEREKPFDPVEAAYAHAREELLAGDVYAVEDRDGECFVVGPLKPATPPGSLDEPPVKPSQGQ